MQFWNSTPRELQLHLQAAAKRFEREHNERAWLAWHIAALGRIKRLPKLEKMLSNRPVHKRQTWQEQMRVMDMWAAATRRKP